MQHNVFDLLGSAVRDGDSIRVTLTRSGGKTTALIVPELKGVNAEDNNEERAKLIGALAQPWKVDAAEGENIGEAMLNFMVKNEPHRNSALSALDELNAALDDAAARARNRTSTTTTKSKVPPPAPAKKDKGKSLTQPKGEAKAAPVSPPPAEPATPPDAVLEDSTSATAPAPASAGENQFAGDAAAAGENQSLWT